MQASAAYAGHNEYYGAIFSDKQRLSDLYGFISRNDGLTFYQCVEVLEAKPNATVVKTFDDWHGMTDRRIARGSKGIPILDALNPNRKKYLFDISQTYGFKKYKTGDNITDTQLLDAVLSLSLWRHPAGGTYRDKLYTAVSDYCESRLCEIDSEQTKKAVIDGVFTCMVSRYNKPQEYIRPEEYSELSANDSVNAAFTAARTAETLFKEIADYRRMRNERNAEQKRSDTKTTGQQGTQANATFTTRQIVQSSFFDFFDEVRDFNAEPSNDIRAGVLSEPDPDGKIIQFSDIRAEGRGSLAGAAHAGTVQAKPDAIGSGDFIYFEDALPESDRAADTRADTVADRLPNYRLTEENFIGLGGQKTRYKNNVEAIRLLQELEMSGMPATEDQRNVLAKYVGWGGLSQAFDAYNADWSKEYAELKELLPAKDYELARSSTLNAFYTSKTVIDAVYSAFAQMGFEDGRVLEPAMGIGNFIGLMPETFKSKVYGVELDRITGQIAKHLYPNADIQISGFEDTAFPDNYFDGAATNVPFGAYSVFDQKYNKHNLFIHDYFILKTLDKLREGGIAAIVTTKGTMDKANADVRKLISERAILLGALRLPNNAFKGYAGTEVTADILFFQKVSAKEAGKQDLNWLNVREDKNYVPINDYYIKHPYMVLGTMKKGMSMYGSENETYCEPYSQSNDGRDLKSLLSNAIEFLPENIYVPSKKTQSMPELSEQEPIPAISTVRNYCYSVIDGKIYMRVDNEMVPQNIPASQEWRLKSMIGLRQQIRNLLQVQNENCPDEILQREQEKLNSMYDRFVQKYGAVNTRTNRNLFRDDADYTLLISIENYDEASGSARKTDIFTKRTIRKYTRPEHADTIEEALQISKNETGRVDLKIMAELTDKTFEQIITELDGKIFRNPEALYDGIKEYEGWETSSEYLSGNVRRKLDIAKTYAKHYPEFEKNAAALQKVQPAPLGASEISVRMGMGWIPPEVYKQFLCEKFKVQRYYEKHVKLEFNRFTESWKLETPFFVPKSFEATNMYGTSRMNGCNIFEHAINLQTPTIYDQVEDVEGNKKRVLNKTETILAREKLRKIQEEFKAWVFDEPKRRSELVQLYNERYNNLVLADYDGSYLHFPEMNPLIELKPHQKNGIERGIVAGNTLYHHVVGAGKTFVMSALAMKLRQLKLAQKPMIIVPNHLVLQWSNEFRRLYPQANLLIATKRDFEKENRLRFVSRIATGDWDAVIMAQSSFEKIPISKQRRERIIRDEIGKIHERLDEARADGNRVTVKIMERVLKNKEERLKELTENKKDDLIKFEDLGVDYLFIDEADKFKNKFIFTKMSNVSGISQAASKRSSDLDSKIDYITELHGGQKGVVFATGTPISNSMVEMFTMQSYLHRQDLAEAGLDVFDHWAANFGETINALELAPSGQGYRSKTRFAKFTNLPELLKMYRKFADVQTADMLKLPVPKANRHVVTIKPTETVLELCDVIIERAEKINNREVPPEVDNMLRITGDGRKLALDPRCFDRSAPDHPDHKVNVAAENIYSIWEKTADRRGTQLVFCDRVAMCCYK